MMHARRRIMGGVAVAAVLWMTGLVPNTAQARTIELQRAAWDRAAVLAADAPHLSWAGRRNHRRVYNMQSWLDLRPDKAFLIRFDLSAIPDDMRITRAEWIMPVNRIRPSEQVRFFVWRMIAPWGPGVCHDYRTQSPEPKPWARPGGRGPGADRAMRPTREVTLRQRGEVVVNVTEDVSLWHQGVVANEGWMITVQDRGALVRFYSPTYRGGDRWKLRITYEPK